MRKYLSALAALALLFSCSSKEDNPSGNALSVTVGADNVSAISVVLKGKANLTSTTASDLQVGFQYSTSAGILPSNSTIVDAVDSDANYNYSTGIPGLQPETTYYFRSFVRQNGQDEYGETKSFTTKALSSMITTQDATEIEATCTKLNGAVVFSDVSAVYKNIEYGFYWGTSEDSQTTSLKGDEIVDNTYTATLTNLFHKTQYWYKAYIKLDNQIIYGDVKTFTTDVVKVESVSLDKTEYTFNTIGKTLSLKATVFPSDATDKSLEWSTSNADVATVDANGKVTAIDNGTAIITVTTKDQETTANCAITVAQYVTAISLNNTSLLLNVGETKVLTATVSPSNANDKTLIWTSSNESVAIVDQDGKVTTISLGATTIKATANDGSGEFAICEVSVYYIPEPVDLGLSVKWASFNIGASRPEEYGDYYAWGETDTKSIYDWSTYKWCNGSSDSLTKYNTIDNKTELVPEDDVAHVKLGGSWRMPTEADWRELNKNCLPKWTDDFNGTGVAGVIVTSKVEGYTDKSIFLPAAGNWVRADISGAGTYGYYWSSSLWTLNTKSAYQYSIRYTSVSACGRDFGLSIRPVTE